MSENVKGLMESDISRRDFLGWFLKGGLLITLGGMIIPALNYIWPVTRQGPVGGMADVGSADDIPVWGGKKVILSGSALLIIRLPREYKAYSAICTHLGCIVDWDGKTQKIICPCHAGIFDTNGSVVAGPPPRSLPSYPVKVINGRLMVTV